MGGVLHIEEHIGVMVKYNGDYWGETYADGHSTCNGYGPIEKADLSDPKYCLKPTDKTYNPENTNGFNPDYDSLKKGELVTIRKTVIFEEV